MNTILDFNHKKATQAINFFACKEAGGVVDKLKVIKLIWLADRLHLRKYGRPIVNDTYYAMTYGPVGSAVKDLAGFNDLGEKEDQYLGEYLTLQTINSIKSVKALDTDVFSDSDINALETVYNEYGALNQFDLVKISHEFPEWKKFKTELETGSSTREVMNYQDFFSNPPAEVEGIKNIFTESGDQLDLAKKSFLENCKVASYWL